MSSNFTTNYKIAISMLCAFLLLSGCSSATAYKYKNAAVSQESALFSQAAVIERLDPNCHSHVLQRESSISNLGDAAQQIALANAATRCIENKNFYPKHPDNQIAMQLNALAIVNFIKAGETQNATHSLSVFRTKFPKQDLLFSDYTSFVDTATALLNYDDLSNREIQVLNINVLLRDELKRQQYWLRN
jgi:hypothetical protein